MTAIDLTIFMKTGISFFQLVTVNFWRDIFTTGLFLLPFVG